MTNPWRSFPPCRRSVQLLPEFDWVARDATAGAGPGRGRQDDDTVSAAGGRGGHHHTDDWLQCGTSDVQKPKVSGVGLGRSDEHQVSGDFEAIST